jgi:hypothetical protein
VKMINGFECKNGHKKAFSRTVQTRALPVNANTLSLCLNISEQMQHAPRHLRGSFSIRLRLTPPPSPSTLSSSCGLAFSRLLRMCDTPLRGQIIFAVVPSLS